MYSVETCQMINRDEKRLDCMKWAFYAEIAEFPDKTRHERTGKDDMKQEIG